MSALDGDAPPGLSSGMDSLKRLRKAAGLSQGQLAELSGVDQSFISRVENGKSDLTVTSLVQIATALRVSPLEMIQDAYPASRLDRALKRIPPELQDSAADILERLADALEAQPRSGR